MLFVLQHPGYTRFFDSTIRGLLERGHTVHIAFEWPTKMAEGLDALEGIAGKLIVDQSEFPGRSDTWSHFAHSLRALVDYVRYLDPRYERALYLRKRMGKKLPPRARFLKRMPFLPGPIARTLRRFCTSLERLIPNSTNVDAYLKQTAPDVVLVSPLVDSRASQTDVIKSAQALGIPVGLCVGSWDHLSNKGMIRLKPDRVFVWNDIQRREAIELHDIPGECVVVTGAQPFDKWFNRKPDLSREAFCRRVGLPPDRQYVLFAGSTASINRPDAEVEFVRQWIELLRRHREPRFRDLSILIRPHPFNSAHWSGVDFSNYADVVIYPRHGTNPVNEEDRADYFHSLYHSAAVVGVNTSAMVEATILGKPVLTIVADEFRGAQQQTLHFHYLLPENGGFLEAAKDFTEHVHQLKAALDDPRGRMERLSRFVDNFIRPRGRDQDCVGHLIGEIEALGRLRCRKRSSVPAWLVPVSRMLEMYLVRLENTPRHIRRKQKELQRDERRRERMRAQHAKWREEDRSRRAAQSDKIKSDARASEAAV